MDKEINYQFSSCREILRNVMRDPVLEPEAKAIFAFIAAFANDDGKTILPASLMQVELNMSEARFYKYRTELIESGYISVRKRRHNGKAAQCEYRVHPVRDVTSRNRKEIFRE